MRRLHVATPGLASRTLILAALIVLAAGPAAARGRCVDGSATGAFAAPGPLGVGVRAATFVDASRGTAAHGTVPALPTRTLQTRIWYPSTGGTAAAPAVDAPLAPGGPFPLVVYSHGYGGLDTSATYFATVLASRGFVVAAPNFPLSSALTLGGPLVGDIANQPGDVRFVIDELLRLSGDAGSWLAGGVDARRIGAQGLSWGGFTTLLAAYDPTLRDRRIRAAVAMAPYACAMSRKQLGRSPALLLLNGDEDLITPLPVHAARTFDRGRMSRTLVTLAHGTHGGFSNSVTVDSPVSYDVLGCPLLAHLTDADFRAAVAPIAGADPAACELPCTRTPPGGPPMRALRQHHLTTAVVVAFFEERLAKSRPARCFLRRQLAAENDDVTVARRGR